MKRAIYNTIDEYIGGFPNEIQKILQDIRVTIHATAPGLEEAIRYAMPTFRLKGKNMVHFAAFKNHIGLYATPEGHQEFKDDFSKYKKGKGSVQFPLTEPIPLELISRVVKFRYKEMLNKHAQDF